MYTIVKLWQNSTFGPMISCQNDQWDAHALTMNYVISVLTSLDFIFLDEILKYQLPPLVTSCVQA